MSAFDHLESPLDEAPEFYIEPKDNGVESEHDRQSRFVAECRRWGLHCDAVPNARQWGMKAWNKAKREGVRWGFSDLVVTGPGRFTAFVEMKDGKKQPEQHQIEFLNSKVRQGFPAAVIRTPDKGMAWLIKMGAPIL